MARIERGNLDAGAPDSAARVLPVDTRLTLDEFLREAERAYLEEVMNQTGGSKKAASRRADIGYNRLLRRLAAHQIKPHYASRRR